MSKRIVFVILSLVCVLVSLSYRNKFYWDFPPVGDTFDEFASGWLGLSLLRTGIPTSWSFIPDYKKGIQLGSKLDLVGTNLAVNNKLPDIKNYSSFPKPISLSKELNLDGYRSQFDIVSPYLEQPPLGGILVSLPLYFSGVKNFTDVTLKALRGQFVIFGVLSTALVMWLAYMWYGKFVSIISGFIYATVPTVVFGSRLALPENLLTVLFLAEIILLEYYRRNKSSYLILLSLVLAYLAPLIKPFGLSLALFGTLYFVIVNKNYRLAFY